MAPPAQPKLGLSPWRRAAGTARAAPSHIYPEKRCGMGLSSALLPGDSGRPSPNAAGGFTQSPRGPTAPSRCVRAPTHLHGLVELVGEEGRLVLHAAHCNTERGRGGLGSPMGHVPAGSCAPAWYRGTGTAPINAPTPCPAGPTGAGPCGDALLRRLGRGRRGGCCPVPVTDRWPRRRPSRPLTSAS